MRITSFLDEPNEQILCTINYELVLINGVCIEDENLNERKNIWSDKSKYTEQHTFIQKGTHFGTCT